MNRFILDPKVKAAAPPALVDAVPGKALADPAGELFRTTLAGRLRPAKLSIVPSGAAPTSGAANTLTALQAKIAKLLESGASQASIVAALAAQLATSVTQKLSTPGAEVREKLQTIFSKALAPPGRGDGAGASIADRARLLAQRYLRIAAVADAEATQGSGQQKRIPGTLLDAYKAKDDPAPTSTILKPASGEGAPVSGLLAATGALAIPAAPPTVAGPMMPAGLPSNTAIRRPGGSVHPTQTSRAASSPLTAGQPAQSAPALVQQPQSAVASVAAAPASAGAGDGRRVVLESGTEAVAAGGDTLLGRILTRAVAAAGQRAADQASAGARSSSAGSLSVERVGPTPGAARMSPASATPAERGAAATGKPASTPANSVQGATATQDKAFAAFAKSFEEALHAGAGAASPGPVQHDAVVAAAAAPEHAAAATPAGFLPPPAPFAIDRPAPNAAVAPPPTAVDHSAIADQVLRGAFLRNTGGSSEMRLTLVPDSLGDLSVKLVVEAGNVTAHVVAQTAEARDALVAAQPQLTKSLADAGLKLQSFNVDLSGSGFAGFAQQHNDGRQTDRRGRHASDGAPAGDERDDSQLEAIPAFGPSRPTGGNAGDYNYLA